MILCAAALVAGTPATARAAGVVGTGIADSCTDTDLNAALAGGGLVTFDCGGPATIDISTGTGGKTITADTTIDGGGLITISGGSGNGPPGLPVFRVSSANFTVRNLTIANGHTLTGGGISNGSGTLTVTNSTFAGNRADDGGGIYNDSGLVTVTNSAFTSNSAAGPGGGIFNRNGTLTVTNSTFASNSAGAGGGGIANVFDSTVTLTNCTLSGNSADFGGGIANGGTLTVTNSTFAGNRADDDGGGIYNDSGLVTVTNSTFTSNSAERVGGGIANQSTAGLTNGTLSGNVGGVVNSDAFGGGIGNRNTVTLTNCTLSGNSADFGGGIANVASASTLTNCTLSGNSADFGGGGIGIGIGGAATLTNSIVANSPTGGNCAATLVDGGHNLSSDNTCLSSSDLVNTDPRLAPLANYGGPTETLALCTAVGIPDLSCSGPSPAIDAGDQAACAAPPVNNRDQRGFVRPGSDHTQCSIGAYEADALEACVGDCDGNGVVAIDELVLGVNIALGTQSLDACPEFANAQGLVDIAQLIQGVNNALNGCSG